MRLLIAGLAVVTFVVGMTVLGLQFTRHGRFDGAPTGPRLEVPASSDLGEVPATGVVERSVPFRNTGVKPLEVSILKVRPTPDGACGCGVESFAVRPAVVPPGEAGELVFMLRVPEGMPPMEDKMTAELQTNDPARTRLKIDIVFWMDS